MTSKNKTKKLFSAVLIILTIVPSVLFFQPKKAEAFWFSTWLTDIATGISKVTEFATKSATITNTGLHIKDVARVVLQEVLKSIARKALAEMTKSTIDWINSGFHGSPLFLQNPDSFFKDIAKSEVENVVNEFGYDVSKFPFGRSFALNVINSYKSTADSDAAYSLSKVINDPVLLQHYQANFAYGGWNGFLMNTQYPQNNYIGSQMQMNGIIAAKLAGLTQAPVQKVQNLLQQGQGFLSPQVCPPEVNANYPIATNPYNPPKFDATKWELDYIKNNPPPSASISSDLEGSSDYAQWKDDHDTALTQAKSAWTAKYTCTKKDGTSGLQNTTPGAVVASQIMTSLKIPQDQAGYSAMVGNSLSAIFDSLLGHFLNKGLSALASKVNPTPKTDDFSYNGITLGSPGDNGTNETWDAGPDQPIVLADFKKNINDALGNTSTELGLMISDDPTNPGIYQMFGNMWPKVRDLDICQPGPDIGWQDRVDAEMARNSGRFQENLNNTNGEKAAKADLGLKELQFAVNFFKDWISNKMLTELPDSPSYIDTVSGLKDLSQQAGELNDKIQAKRQAVIRLQAIKTALDKVTVQPTPGGTEDKNLVSIWKQYSALSDSISNTVSIEDTRSELATLKDQLKAVSTLVTQCQAERVTKGWIAQGGPTALLDTSQGANSTTTTSTQQQISILPANSEQSLFCDLPIAGGYSHASFINTLGVTYPKIPLVNAKNVSTGSKTSNILLSCNIIFKANVLDYKGDLPGLTSATDSTVQLPDDTGGEINPPVEPPTTQ